MKISRLALLVFALLPLALAAAACGGDGDDDGTRRTATASVTTTLTVPSGPTATPQPISQLRVAFINLYSPLTTDPDNQVAAETFSARIKQVADEVKRLDPDIIAFSEASVTASGNAIEQLVAELKLEPAYLRANPGFGLEKPQADEIVRQLGFEEGELLFSRYPILGFERIELSPRSSELGEGRIALHARIKAPAPLGEFNVFLTHLTGGGESIRHAQAEDLVAHIAQRSEGRPTLLVGDMGDPVDSATYEVFRQAGFMDPGWDANLPTCCRESVVGDQPELTVRTDCIMAQGFASGSAQLFAQHPVTQTDGSTLYASDHNGLLAVFVLEGG